jgi:HSF-type DNA-binding
MRRSDRHYPHSPPRHYVTPSENRYEYEHRHRPVVYQVYGHHHMPEAANNGFPGGFSPVRTSRSLRNHISPPSASRTSSSEENLYASFSPPRRSGPRHHPHHPHSGAPPPPPGSSSIFRPRQSVIVAREPSHHDDEEEEDHHHSTDNQKMPATTMASKEPPVNRSSVSSFPSKLHAILSSPEYQDVISFLPHGRAWRVLKPKAFEESVIPKFFRSSKYASFMR